MKNLIIAPDSFKGTMSSQKVCEIISSAAKAVDPEINTIMMPIADGGEGTIDVFCAKKIYCDVSDALFQPIESYWGDFGDRAIIELATVCGLPGLKTPNPLNTTTFGFGQLIKNALDLGKRKFILALGGSSTNDFGFGMAAALGVKFFRESGEEFIPTGGTLSDVFQIDLEGLDPRVKESEFITMCDVTNPLYGKNGAAYVFAPQKGATEKMLPILDDGLRHSSKILEEKLGFSFSELPGAGAAGGCGAASVAFLSATLQSGIDVVLDLCDFDNKLVKADLVISGEGKFDSQSISGKALSGISRRCLKMNKPLVVLCGAAEENMSVYENGVTSVFSIVRKPASTEEAFLHSEENVYRTAYNVIRLFYSKA